MIARGFKSVLWVGAVGSAALGCYMVSLRVATERADLTRVEHQIVEAKRDIRSLQTELGTRGRLTQLEDWNSNVLALGAPTSNQFVKDGYALAALQTRQATVADRTGDVRMASLDTGAAAPEAKPAAPAPAAPAAAAKPANSVTASAPAAPRIVRAVAAPPEPREAPLIRRASFVPSAPAEAVSAPKHDPAKPARAQAGIPVAHAAPAKPDPAKKAKPAEALASAKHDPHAALRTAAADRPQAAKPAKTAKPAAPAHASTKLAGADSAAHNSASGHRGGAQ
jgi:hypothetical protein